jgi:hypothetical protein
MENAARHDRGFVLIHGFLKSLLPINAAATDHPSRARTLIKIVLVRGAMPLTPKSGHFAGSEFFSDAPKLTR